MNLMAYPSAEKGLSDGLRDGIQTGLAMRKQQQDEKTAEFQKQKYEEQQALNKAVQASEPLKSVLTGKYPAATQKRAYDSLKGIWKGVGVEFPDLDFSKNGAEFMSKASVILDDAAKGKTSWTTANEAFNDLKAEHIAQSDFDTEDTKKIELIEKTITPNVEDEYYKMGEEAASYYPQDKSAEGYFAKGGKAGTAALKNLQPDDETTKTINSWAQAMFNKSWGSLSQPEKLEVMDRMSVENPSKVRQSAPPIYNIIPGYQTQEGQPVKTSLRSPSLPSDLQKTPSEADVAAARTKVGADALLDELDTAFAKADKDLPQTSAGRVLGYPERKVKQFTQSSPALSYANSLAEGFLAKFARAAGEVGVLNEGDIKRAKELTYTINDTPEVRALKREGLKNLFNEIYERGKRQENPLGKNNKGTTGGQSDLRSKYGY